MMIVNCLVLGAGDSFPLWRDRHFVGMTKGGRDDRRLIND